MADEALREVFVRFSAEVEGEDELEHVGHAADEAKEHVKEAGEHAEHAGGLFKTLGEAVEGVAAVFGASELLRGVRETTTELAELAHLSEQTGVSAEKLEFLGFVVGQVGGDVGEFRSQLSALQRSLSQTEAGTAPQTAALKKLGIEARNADGSNRDMNAILPEIFANFGNLKDANEETAVATRLFGKSGLALLPVLREGAKGFDEYREAFEASGGATPEEAIERAKEYEKALKRMNAAFGDLKTHLVTGVLPALTHVVEGVTDFTAGLSHFLKGTTAASHVTLALAAALAGPLLRSLGPFLKPGLKFLAIYAAVDDVLAFLEGKDSLIGRAIDGLFGEGSGDQVRAFFAIVKEEFAAMTADSDAAYVIMGDQHQSWVDRVIAGFALVAAQGPNAFTAIAEGWSSMVAGMGIAFGNFVDGALAKIQALLDTLHTGTLGTLIKLAPGGGLVAGLAGAEEQSVADKRASVQQGVKSLRNVQDFLGQRAYDREQQRAPNAPPASPLRDERGAVVPNAGAAFVGSVPTSEKEKAQARQGEQFAVLGAAHAAGVTATVNQDNKVDIHLPPGVSRDSELAKMVGDALSKALKDNNRTALQQITQRGSK